MSTTPGGDEPRADQPVPDEPRPTVPEPSPDEAPPAPPVAPVVPPAEPPTSFPPPGGGYPPPGAFPPPPETFASPPGTFAPPAGANPLPPSYQPPASYPPPGATPPPGYRAPPPAYQAPPAGYQAPPPGYQAPPPGYPAGGYQQPPMGYGPPMAQPSLFGVALSDGWRSFQRVGWTFVGAFVVWGIVALAVVSLVSAIFGGWTRLVSPNGAAFRGFAGTGFTVGTVVVSIVGALVAALVQAQFVRVALTVTRGHRPVFAEFFHVEEVGPIVTVALIIALAEGILGSIRFFGGLLRVAVAFFVFLVYFVLLDRRVPPVDAIRQGVDLVVRNLGQTLVFFILSGLIILGGLILCFIGVFVAAPVVLLATAYLYRRLSGEQPQLPA